MCSTLSVAPIVLVDRHLALAGPRTAASSLREEVMLGPQSCIKVKVKETGEIKGRDKVRDTVTPACVGSWTNSILVLVPCISRWQGKALKGRMRHYNTGKSYGSLSVAVKAELVASSWDNGNRYSRW